MASFLEGLRARNIFNGNPFMPKQEDPLEMLQKFKMLNPEPPPMIQQIGQQIAQPQQQPQNVVFRDQIDPYQQARLELSKQQLSSKEKIESGKQDIDRQKLGISQQRADVYEFSKRNPQLKFVQNKLTGELEAVNSLTGETVKNFGQTQIGQEDLINLNQEKALEKITKTGEQARETEGVRQKGRETIEDIKARHAKELEEFKSETPSKSADLPTQQSKKFQVNYNKLINAKPEYRKFVSLDENGMPIIKQPGGGHFGYGVGPTPEQYKEINEAIFGKSDVKTEEKPNVNIEDDKVLVVNPEGKRGKIPRSQLADALKQGYKEVK